MVKKLNEKDFIGFCLIENSTQNKLEKLYFHSGITHVVSHLSTFNTNRSGSSLRQAQDKTIWLRPLAAPGQGAGTQLDKKRDLRSR